MRTALCIAVAGTLVGAAVAGLPAAAGAASVEVSRGDDGLTLVAGGARLEDVLRALAAQEGFAVVMQPDLEAPLVDVSLHDASLEQALRRVLGRRNYAISYARGEHGLAVSRVEVLTTIEAAATGNGPAGPKVAAAAAPAPSAEQRQAVASAQRRRQPAPRQQAANARQDKVVQRRRDWVERARQAQRSNEAQQAAATETVPLRRQLWGRSH